MSRNEPTCPHCGGDLTNAKRSVPQHRRYFAMVRAYFHHWPENHETQFASEEECRKWLQMKAGHRVIAARIPLAGINKDKAAMIAEAAIRAAGSFAVPVVHGTDLVVFVPKSIAFGKLGHQSACALFDDVAAVAEAETGLNAETVMKEMENAA